MCRTNEGHVKKSMAKTRVIGFTDFFGKVNAIVVKEDKVELQETEIRKFDCCWID